MKDIVCVTIVTRAPITSNYGGTNSSRSVNRNQRLIETRGTRLSKRRHE